MSEIMRERYFILFVCVCVCVCVCMCVVCVCAHLCVCERERQAEEKRWRKEIRACKRESSLAEIGLLLQQLGVSRL